MDVVFLQSADAFHYLPMLQETSRTVIEYCRRASFRYEGFVGHKRGHWPWQATYNRIFQFRELVERGFAGWAVYLDADAFIVDLDFDLRGYLADKDHHLAVMTPSMATPHRWDINNGVLLLNLAHPGGRDLLNTWQSCLGTITDHQLRDAADWGDVEHDQTMLQGILRVRPDLLDQVFLQSTDLMNSRHGTFIRQHLRADTPTLDDRIARIRAAVHRVMDHRAGAPAQHSADDGVAASELVAALYEGLLGREPDPDGGRNAAASVELLGVRAGVRALASDIVFSAEFRSRLGTR